MTRTLHILLAYTFAGFGAFIFITPMIFYKQIPGVEMLGPFSVHFIRDAGLAYFASGAIMIWGAIRQHRELAMAGALWPCLHALFHLQMWIARGVPADLVAFINLFGIQLPAWLSLYLAIKISGRA